MRSLLAAVFFTGGLLLGSGGLGAQGDVDIPEVARSLLEEADRYRDAGRVEEAIGKYREVLDTAPSVTAASISLGALLSSRGDHEGALAAFTGGLDHDPDNAQLLFNAALMAMRLERLDEALGFVDRALVANRRDANLYSLRSAVLRQMGKLDESLAAIEAAVRQDAGNPQILFRLGNLYYELDAKKEAIEAFQKAVQKDKDFLRAYYNLGAVLFDVGRFDDALTAYRVALEPIERAFAAGEEVEPEHARAYLNLGAIYVHKEDWSRALDAYTKALRLDPRQTSGHYNQGYVLYRLNRIDEADRAYRRAIELDPDLPLARLHLGLIAHRRGEHGEAVEQLGKAVELVDGDQRVEALLALADSRQHLGDTAAAEAGYRAVLAAEPDRLTALLGLGRLRRRAGDLAAARQLLERARSLAPESTTVVLELAAMAKTEGRIDDELTLYQDLVRKGVEGPEAARVRLNLALVHLRRGATVEARRLLDELLAEKVGGDFLGPDQQRLLATVQALLLAAEGSPAAAEEQLAAVVREAPDFPPAVESHAVLGVLAGRPGAAVDSLRATLSRHQGGPLEPLARANLGQALWLAGRDSEARPHLERAAAALDGWIGLHVALGEIALGEGDLAGAVRRLERAADLCGATAGTSEDTVLPTAEGTFLVRLGGGPGGASAELCTIARGSLAAALLGSSYDDLGRHPGRARDQAGRALGLPLGDVHRAVALFVRGTARLRTGDDGGARADLEAALGSGRLPDRLRPLARNNLGVALYRRADFAGAREAFEGARADRARFPEATLNLGILLDDHSDEARRALALYREYLDLGGARAADVRPWVEKLGRIYR